MKGQLSTPEQRGMFIIMHSHEYGIDDNTNRVVRRLKITPGVGQEVLARDGKRKYIVGPRGNLLRQPGTNS